MTTSAESNYGGTFTKGGSLILDCDVLDYPEFSVANLDATTHGDAGVEQRLPGKKLSISTFTLSLPVVSGIMNSIDTEIDAGTVSACVLELGDVIRFSFDGFFVSYKGESADANSEDVAKMSVVVQPTGGVTVLSL